MILDDGFRGLVADVSRKPQKIYGLARNREQLGVLVAISMEVIKLMLTDDDLANITGGITIEKRIKNNEKDIVMSVSYTGGKMDAGNTTGKDDPGGNDDIFTKFH